MSFKFVHLRNDVLNKCLKIKRGIIWSYLCSKDVPLTVEEIANHYNLSVKQVQITFKKLLEIKAIFEEVKDGKLYYRANPATYFHSNGTA